LSASPSKHPLSSSPARLPVHTDAGAPSRYTPHTALLALLLALYAIFPPAYVLGPPRLGLPLLSTSTGDAVVQNDLWVRIFAERELVIGPFRLRPLQ
jgi:hypothetical protein